MTDSGTSTDPTPAITLQDRLRAVLKSAGLSASPGEFDSDIHSWRCGYPDRYGACTCLDDLVGDLIAELVPEHRILVSFAAVTDYESGDWEHCLPEYDYTDLAEPEVIAHHLDDGELARLHYQIESMGTLGESDAYNDLDKAIETISEPAATAERKRNSKNPLKLEL